MEIEKAKAIAATGKAILVEADLFDEPVWKTGHEGTLVVSDWWALKQGWD